MRTHTATSLALLLLLAAPSLAIALSIDTTTSWDGSSFAAPTDVSGAFLLGQPNIATIGQTFTAAKLDPSPNPPPCSSSVPALWD